ncbi:MAG: PAS domain S-box protein [Planctomycetota bacterium]|jgi:PAS domain S-box-containing protein
MSDEKKNSQRHSGIHNKESLEPQNSEQLLRQLAENIRGVFWIHDLDSDRFVYVSGAYETIFGRSCKDLYENPQEWIKAVHPDDQNRIKRSFKKEQRGICSEYEYKIVRPDGSVRWIYDRGFQITNESGQVSRLAGIAEDITERKKAEDALNLHDLRLQALLNLYKMAPASQQAILDFVREEIIQITQSEFAFIGFLADDESMMSMDNWSKKTMAQCAVVEKPMHFPIAQAGLWTQAIHQRKPVIVNDYESSNLEKKGYPKGHVPLKRLLSVPVFEGERIVALAAVANKQTDYDELDVWAATSMMNDMWRLVQNKQSVEAIQKSEANYKTIFSAANDAMFVHDVENARILSANDMACEMFGYNQEEFLDLTVEDISKGLPPYTQQVAIGWIKKAANEGPQLFEWICKDKTGKTFWVDVNLKLAVIEGTNRMLAIVRNINERKQAEARQQLANKILGRLNQKSQRSELARDVLALIKEAMGFTAVAIRLRDGDDFPYFQADGFSDEFVKSENYLCTRDQCGKIIRDSDGQPVVECMCGKVVIGNINPALPFFTEGGSFWTSSTTELLKQTALKEQLGAVRSYCNQAGFESVALVPLRSGNEVVGLLQLNDQKPGRFTPETILFLEGIGASIGIALARITAQEEVRNLAKFPSENPNPVLRISKDYTILYANELSRPVLETWQCEIGQRIPEACRWHIDESLKSVSVSTFEFTCHDGTIFLATLAPVPNDGYVNVYGLDITQQKKNRQALQESEERYRNVYDTAPSAFVVWDNQCRITGWNKSAERIFGWSQNEVMGKVFFDFLIPEPELSQVDSIVNSLLQGQLPSQSINTNLTKSGKIILCQWNNSILKDANGQIIGAISMALDITEQQKAQEQIEKQQYYLAKAQEIGSIGTWELDIKQNTLVWTDENYRIFGVPIGTELTYEIFLNCVHPDDRQYVNKKWKAALENEPYDIEHRLIVDGKIKWVREKAEVEFDQNGNCLRGTGFTQDITERKQAEQQLENLAKFPSENPYPVIRIAENGKILYSNSAGSEILRDWSCQVGENAPEHWQKYILRVLENGIGSEIEFTCQDKIFSLIVAPVVDAGYANVYGIDITERKQAEEDLRQYRLHLEELVKGRTQELTVANEQLLRENEQRKSLERQILEISEREQRRIGQELHDSIGQQFTGIAFMTKVLEQRLSSKLPKEAASAAQIAKLVNQATEQARSLAKGLHPIDLEAGSLTSALEDLAVGTQNLFGIRCTFNCNKQIETGNTTIAVNVYRIVQEAINNAIKHGNAHNISIKMVLEGDKSVLTIENDGSVFPDTIDSKGMGLQIMNHRAELIDGLLEVRKGAKGGAVVTCAFPMTNQ